MIHGVNLLQVWPHADYPLIPVGKLVLDRNPTNYFAEVEQIAFSPAHMVPGIEPSPDKMLQVIFYIPCLPFHYGHSNALAHLLAEVRKYHFCAKRCVVVGRGVRTKHKYYFIKNIYVHIYMRIT